MMSRCVPFSPTAYHLTLRNLNYFNASELGRSVRRTDLEKAFNVRTPARPANGNSRVLFINHERLQHRPQIGKRTSKLRKTLSETLLCRWSSARGAILKRFTVYAVEKRPINGRVPQRQPLRGRRNELSARGCSCHERSVYTIDFSRQKQKYLIMASSVGTSLVATNCCAQKYHLAQG
jgi:hypothetical protein